MGYVGWRSGASGGALRVADPAARRGPEAYSLSALLPRIALLFAGWAPRALALRRGRGGLAKAAGEASVAARRRIVPLQRCSHRLRKPYAITCVLPESVKVDVLPK